MKLNIKLIALFTLPVFSLSGVVLSQSNPQKRDDQTIRISTELVQMDVVVTDKKGKVVSGLNKEDFELFENGKKQQISFFEFVAGGLRPGAVKAGEEAKAPGPEVSPQGADAGDIRRIFAFVVDDLTIRHEDLVYIRQMLSTFVDSRMQPSDLVAIIRTVGGKGLLQQFTTDKVLLRRAIAALTPRVHPLSAHNNPDAPNMPNNPQALLAGSDTSPDSVLGESSNPFDISSFEPADPNSINEETNRSIRAFMSLGTASFVIDSMRELPGRKSLVLISGGMPILSSRPGTESNNITLFLRALSDNATRAGVTIHTMDIRGLEAQRAVASFEETPGRSMISMPGSTAATGTGGAFGRTADEAMLGRSPIESHQSLRMLASSTGGLAILNKNNFDEGLEGILSQSEGYYLLAYTPADAKFDNKFREIKIKVKGNDYKVYSRQGYFAREERAAAATAAATKQEQILAAVRSPLARRDINLDATLLYKAAPPDQGTIDIHIVIDPRKLQFDQVDGKQQTSLDVAGFVFDELGKLRGGFSETINANLSQEELARVSKGGLTYSANTTLPAGAYQVRLAVRDNKSNNIGTMSRYLEVPDLSKGRLTASSLLLGAVPAGDMKSANPTPISANRQIARTQDLRYAAIIYNSKQKDGKPQVRTQLVISQGGKVIFKEPEEQVAASGGQLIKWGQLGLKAVKPGRYTLSLVITDPLADKKANTITRSMDFVVVD
ncbi:MAG TPA: VWA domain-containing protein [Blastocatellia bacterium]|nr:VWA domain-containing protein [Blastocatellia bacterium]